MSDAQKILSERLAKGEISEAEYDRLVAKLGHTPSSPAEGTKLVSPTSKKTDNSWIGYLVGGGIVVGVLLMIGSSRVNSQLEELSVQCRAKNSAEFCDCAVSVFRQEVSAFDEAPIFRLFADQSDARSEKVISRVNAICLK